MRIKFARSLATTPHQTNVRWLLVTWIFVLSAVAFLDRVNISIAGSVIAREYDLTNVQLGYIFSAFLVGYAVFQTPGGWLADRLGPRWVIGLAVIWWGVFTVLTASIPTDIAQGLLLLISVRILLGAGEAVMFPASNQFVAHWIPTEERGAANGLIFAGIGVGAGVTPPVITYIMTRYGWRTSFWVSAGVGLAAGAIWVALARDKPSQHSWVGPSEMMKIRDGLTLGPEELLREGTRQIPWRTILMSKDVLAVTLSYFSYGYAAWIFFSWFFIYLSRVRGLNLHASSYYATLPFLAMAAGSAAGGVASDWLTCHLGKRIGRCVFSCAVMVLAAVFLAFGPLVASAGLASVVLAGGAGALYLSQSCYWAISADLAGPSAGAVSGFMNMGAQIGGAITATLTPAIATGFGWTASFVTAATLCALGGVTWLTVNPYRSLVSCIDLTDPGSAL